MYTRFIKNDVLANLAFLLVLIIGGLSYLSLPRQQDPEISFNWIQIVTNMPGASAQDIERRVTEPIEDAIRNITDIRFVMSQSRDSLSLVLVRFNELPTREFDKRLADLRREIQNKEAQLPDAADTPFVFEITTSNGFPTATVLVTGPALDENLRRYAKRVSDDLTRMTEVDRITMSGFSEPELQVTLRPEELVSRGLNPNDVSTQLASLFQDVSAGDINIGNQSWLVRLKGVYNNPNQLGKTLIQTPNGNIPLASIARVERSREAPTEKVTYNGRPGILLGVAKSPNVNTLTMVQRIKTYLEERNQFEAQIGVKLVLVDDQTEMTRNALQVMQSNALLGLLMVLVVTILFLGVKISLLISAGIPFVLAGVFWVMNIQGETLNVMVLLGIVISLGMLVDDAVVVVESIYYRLERGMDVATAAVEGLKEVIAPVTASVLTTIAAFLPLMLLPGIIGQFLKVVPLVVTLALLLSLLEAYWMLPAHIIGFNVQIDQKSRSQKRREYFLRRLRHAYSHLLIRALRYPIRIAGGTLCVFLLAIGLVLGGAIKADFFASDTLRLFYINVEMPPGTPLEKTLKTSEYIERLVRQTVKPEELRSVVSTAGQQQTETSPLAGNVFGQVTVSLLPAHNGMASVEDIIAKLEDPVQNLPGPLNISFLRLSGGPPTTSPIELKLQGSDFAEIRRAAQIMMQNMKKIEGLRNIKSDDSAGQKLLSLELDQSAISQAGLSGETVKQAVALLVDGQIISTFQDKGEEVRLRIQIEQNSPLAINEVLAHRLVSPTGQTIPLSQLVKAQYIESPTQIIHYNYLRAITLFAGIDTTLTDTQKANRDVLALWQTQAKRFPTLQVDQSGLLDDLNESLNSILTLFLFGLLLMYLIIATQFRSYFQPLIVLLTVGLAFLGVVFGLAVSQKPFSLYTMYGAVALAGISVNAAIVLVSAANDRMQSGMSSLHAVFYAGRRRVTPILITSLTTIAGLLSLALGIGGKSTLWAPIATVIVWGLFFSTCLTLFVVPGLYLGFEGLKSRCKLKRVNRVCRKEL
ncbi:MAG: efflux RND transporter permease subunit [Limnobacter sp.]|nr:efflux RND transporter permease subunit [Limnobacter sp.]